MNASIQAILLLPIPASQKMCQYIGQEFQMIIDMHQQCKIIVPDSRTPHMFVIEVRLIQSTLTCFIENRICTEAFLFEDGEISS